MKKIFMCLGIFLIIFGTTALAADTQLYSFELPFDGDMSIRGMVDMFTISNSPSYAKFDDLDKPVNDTVYVQDSCTIKALYGITIHIYPVSDDAKLADVLNENGHPDTERLALISDVWPGCESTYNLEKGTYVLILEDAGMSTECRLVVGRGGDEQKFKSLSSDETSVIRVVDVQYPYEIEVEIIKEIEVNEDNVAKTVKDVLTEEYGYDVIDVTYEAGVLTVNFDKDHFMVTDRGSAASAQYYAKIRETIFSCDFIKVVNEQLNGEYTFTSGGYNFNPISYYEYDKFKIKNIDYSKTLPEKALYDYYERNFKRDYERRKETDAFLADLNGDAIPELLVRYCWTYSYIDVYQYVNGEIVKTEDVIYQMNGTGINDDLHFLIMDDGKIQILNSYIFDNGMIGEHHVSGESYCVYAWQDKQNAIDLSYDEFKKLKDKYTIASTQYDIEPLSINLFWDESFTDKEKFDYIWNKQKSLYNNVVLKLGSNVMFAQGKNKFIDSDNSIIPLVDSQRVLVPLRAVSESLGAQVSWDADALTATAVLDGTTVKVPLESSIIYKNSTPLTIDVCAKALNGRIFVPLRAIGEAFGCDVNWNGKNMAVEIDRI